MSNNLDNARTILDYFYEFEQTKANEVYLNQPDGGVYKTYTWKEVGDQARRMANAIKSHGFPPKSNIGLISKNCAHWMIADLAIMMSGHVSVPFYASLTAEQLNEVLTISDTKLLFVGKMDDWDSQKSGVPADLPCVSLPHLKGNSKVEGFKKWEDLLAEHEPMTTEYYPTFEELFTIMFTSGTTGTPKGVMLTYGATAKLLAAEHQSNALRLFEGDVKRYFSYLPLNHIAERNLIQAGSMVTGGSVSFVESLDTFAQNLQETRPTLFIAVPRIWTKFHLGILGKMPQKRLDLLLKIPVIKNVIKKKIKAGLGLDQTRIILTGAAPMPTHLLNWYQKLGIVIQEVYAMTENHGGATLMPYNDIQSGSVGIKLANSDIKIDEETGEVCTKAPWQMTGYYNAPEKTAEVIRDGWIHTGDQGEITKDGHLRLTGRVKDTFKTTKGEYVVPGPIEFKFVKSNLIEQICIVGLGTPQPMALVNLSEIAADFEKGEIIEEFEALLKEANATLQNFEKVKKIIVMSEAWSVENGILTPTLKIKRNQLDKKYKDSYHEWYAEDGNVLWK